MAGRAVRVGVGALVVGGATWAVVRFGVPVWLTNRDHPLRPVLEALSWVAGIAGLLVAIGALVASTRAPGGGGSVRNTVTGRVDGQVLQAGTITGPVTMNSTAVALPVWVRLAVAGVVVVVAGVATLAVVVLTRAEEPELRAVVTVGAGSKCAGGWVVPTPAGPVPVSDRPEGATQADQGLVSVTLQGSLPAAVVLQSMRAEVVSRRPASTGVWLETPCGGDVTPRSFGVDLNKPSAAAVGLPGADGGEKVPAPSFPFQVNESEVEQFLITPNVSTDDVEWRLRVTWTSGTRRGETVIDDNGRPFRTTGTTAVSALYCADLNAGTWHPADSSARCGPLRSAAEAGLTGTWEGRGTLRVADDGTAVWTTGTGEARIRLLSILNQRATADVTASTTPEIAAGERLSLFYFADGIAAHSQLGAELTWCRPGKACG
ncbi:hypothetical protein [Actinokineospora diospyrosa]|uniref:RDD family protein n=1 Tax=Actinokineospora diospyrosa TaxID=103728 RepID=A0ABT1IBE1_9PSEU|nr:hypothetical protein [Actinokineospora diospyrosa]MCP2269953.1 hypothetical protein [Actinokineospora diospyrosa]